MRPRDPCFTQCWGLRPAPPYGRGDRRQRFIVMRLAPRSPPSEGTSRARPECPAGLEVLELRSVIASLGLGDE